MRRRMLVKAEFDDQGKVIFGDDPRHSRYSEVAESIERARRAQQENEQRHDVQLEISDRDPGDEHFDR